VEPLTGSVEIRVNDMSKSGSYFFEAHFLPKGVRFDDMEIVARLSTPQLV